MTAAGLRGLLRPSQQCKGRKLVDGILVQGHISNGCLLFQSLWSNLGKKRLDPLFGFRYFGDLFQTICFRRTFFRGERPFWGFMLIAVGQRWPAAGKIQVQKLRGELDETQADLRQLEQRLAQQAQIIQEQSETLGAVWRLKGRISFDRERYGATW